MKNEFKELFKIISKRSKSKDKIKIHIHQNF